MLLHDCWKSWNCGIIIPFVTAKIKQCYKQCKVLAVRNEVITYLLKNKALCIETCVPFLRICSLEIIRSIVVHVHKYI